MHSFCLASKTAKQWVSHCSLTKGSHFAAVGVEKLVMAEAGGTRRFCSRMKVAHQGFFMKYWLPKEELVCDGLFRQ